LGSGRLKRERWLGKKPRDGGWESEHVSPKGEDEILNTGASVPDLPETAGIPYIVFVA
jgi:hypothetical protein